MYFDVENFAQIPTHLKEQADFIFIEKEDVRWDGEYPLKKYEATRQVNAVVEGKEVEDAGSATYTGSLRSMIPGTFKLTSSVSETEVVITDEGAEFVEIEADGEDITITADDDEVVGHTLTVKKNDLAPSDLEVDLIGKKLVINLAMEQELHEYDNGVTDAEITIEVQDDGATALDNPWTLNVVIPDEEDAILDSEVDSENKVLTVFLATDSEGDVDDTTGGAGPNEITEIAAEIATHDEFTASTPGTDTNAWINEDTVEFEVDFDEVENGLDDIETAINTELTANFTADAGADNNPVGEDELVEGQIFMSNLDRDGSAAGTIDYETGTYTDADFDGTTDAPVLADFEYKRFNSIAGVLDFVANTDATVIYVPKEGLCKGYNIN